MIELDYKQNDANWFDNQFKKSFIDLEDKPIEPEPIITIGTYFHNGIVKPNPVMRAGGISIISAPSKSFKTYIKKHLAAAFLRNDYDRHLNHIRGYRKQNECLIDIDSEQDKSEAYEVFKGTANISGIKKLPYYYPFKLRHLSASERVLFLKGIFTTNRITHKPRLIFLDGLADFTTNENELEPCKLLIEDLMTITDEHNCHICGIIHNAYGTKKPTGHLGSVSVKKGQSVMNMIPELIKEINGEERKTGIVKVTHQYSRKAPFEDFSIKKHPEQDHLILVEDDGIF